MQKLVEIKEVSVNFYTYEGTVKALNGLNLDIFRGETLGLVGETGCGKTMTALSILRLIMPPGKIESGSIMFSPEGSQPVDLLAIDEKDVRAIRGSKISRYPGAGSALTSVTMVTNSKSFCCIAKRNGRTALRTELSL